MATSKNEIWASLKAIGYTSEQLKADTGLSYQLAGKCLLAEILHNKTLPVETVTEITDYEALFNTVWEDQEIENKPIPVEDKRERRSANTNPLPVNTGIPYPTNKGIPYIPVDKAKEDQETLKRMRELSSAIEYSQVWENGELIDKQYWSEKNIYNWIASVLPKYGVSFDPTKSFTLLVWFQPEKEWRRQGETFRRVAIKTESKPASMNRKKTAFYTSAHAPAPGWASATLKNLEKVSSEFILDSFYYKEPIEREHWKDQDIPEYSKLKPNDNLLRLEFRQGKTEISYQMPKKADKVHKKIERVRVAKRSDLKLHGLLQTTGKDRLVWHPVLNKAEVLTTRFRFNVAANRSASDSLEVWLDYKAGDKDHFTDPYKPLHRLGTVEVIPHMEVIGYKPEIERYNLIASVASKKVGLDDSALAHYINSHEKVKEYFKGIRFVVYNGIISRKGEGLQAIATRQVTKVQNKVLITPSKECYKQGKHFPAMLETLRDAERWLQHNYSSLIEDQTEVTQSGKANHAVSSNTRFISKQLLRDNWNMADGSKLDECTALSIAARLMATLTPHVVVETTKRLSIKGAKKVSDLLNPKQLGLMTKDNLPSQAYYDLIKLLVKTVTEIELVH